MDEPLVNSLVISRPSDTPLSVALHPLVLLTASDLITRHRVRQEKGPLAGILLGTQHGQDITAEHAFAANLKSDGSSWKMDEDWTNQRIQQFKDVHKSPALEAVGWFTLSPESGPLPEHVGLQQQFQTLINENAILLTIHPSAIGSTDTTNRKLPLTVYEGVIDGEDNSMQVDGEEHGSVKFRSVTYTIETDEPEMIAIDYVAKGAGSAAAVDGQVLTTIDIENKEDIKGKGKLNESGSESAQNDVADRQIVLTTEEEDQLAGMTTRLNSVKMLQTRLNIISKFITSLPPSYISDQTVPLTLDSPDPSQLSHLRNIQALLTRLSLLTPSPTTTTNNHQPQQARYQQTSPKDAGLNSFQEATRSQSNDVALISMLSQLGQGVQGLNELGRKFAQVESGKSARSKRNGNISAGGFGGYDDGDGRVGGFTMRDNILV